MQDYPSGRRKPPPLPPTLRGATGKPTTGAPKTSGEHRVVGGSKTSGEQRTVPAAVRPAPPRALGTILRNHFGVSDDALRDALIQQDEERREPGAQIEGTRIGEILVLSRADGLLRVISPQRPRL